DNCPLAANSNQADTDLDGTGSVSDLCTDTDNDGFWNPGFPANTCPKDNCPLASNPTQADQDVDGFGNVCDNCPEISNPSQSDSDNDGLGDACDTDPTLRVSS